MPKHLESLPAELGTMVLELSANISSLSALVRASPIYHNSYLAQRSKILTIVTLRTLKRRKVDVLRPGDFAKIHAAGTRAWDIDSAVLAARQQHASGSTIRLRVPDCVVLAKLTRFKTWNIIPNSAGGVKWLRDAPLKPGEVPIFNPLRRFSGGYRWGRYHQPYHILSLSQYEARDIRHLLTGIEMVAKRWL